MKKAMLLICCFLSGCTGNIGNDLAAVAVIGGAGYGIYRLHQISEKTASSNETYYPDCKTDCYQNLQGCCSWHVGVLGCMGYRVYCKDNTISDSCICSVPACVAYNSYDY